MAEQADGSDPERGRVQALVQQGRLAEAGRLCAELGDFDAAAELLEQACEFAAAAEQAMAAGALGRAARLAALADSEPAFSAIRQRLRSDGARERTTRIAAELASRGHHGHAAELLEDIEAHAQAAEAFERAARALEAAHCYELARLPAEAARVLESALRAAPTAVLPPSHADELRLALGELYARHQRHQAAVRVLQRLAPGSPGRRSALPSLARAFDQLGLAHALRKLEPELRSAGLELVQVLADADASKAARKRAAGPSPEGGALLYGRYRVVREVAHTPHARVLEARDALSGDRVAVKVFASRARGAGRDALERFLREARALAELRHPNVVGLRELLKAGPAMVLDWAAGGSLRELLDREPLSPARAVEIARAVLSALGQAHRLGILHRDVKPSNVLFDGAGAARLGDFGAAHLGEAEATVTAGRIGTVAYMSPEQRRGLRATVQSDLFSVGVLLFEMLTGRLPARGLTPSGHHPELDERHDAVVARLTREEPTERYDSAQAAIGALGSLSWPAKTRGQRAAKTDALPAEAPSPTEAERLTEPRGPAHPHETGVRRHDGWLGRDVIILPCNAAHLELASAVARAGHPALPTVLRADRGRQQIWLAPPPGASLQQAPGPLTEPEHELLVAALDRLHAAAGAHGCIDASHVYRHGAAVYLAFPRTLRADASAEGDRRALAELRGPPVAATGPASRR